LDGFELSIDRDAEVPIGVQLAWALRARIHDGRFKPGQRIPGLRDLADATGVNINTVKAVYQRLEQEGLIESQQGSGTFVEPTPRKPSRVATIVANAVREARETGVDPRDVAAALYVSSERPAGSTDQAADPSEQRRLLRRQIAAFEGALGELEAEYPGVAPAPTRTYRGLGPALLSAQELAQARTSLLRRLATVQSAIDELTQVDNKLTSTASKKQAAKRKATTKPKRTSGPRAAAHPGTAGA